MDIISHGLWSSISFGRKNRRSFWLAFFFGVAPDLFSFGIFTVSVWFGFAHGLDWSNGPPNPALIPAYVHQMYNLTHSLVVFVPVFALIWLIRKKPVWEMLGWPLHILVDIPTHSDRFFPTPFLWPLSDVHFSGIPWSRPEIFIPNVTLLVLLYFYFFVVRKYWVKKEETKQGIS